MGVTVVAADPRWPAQFRQVAADLATALAGIRVEAIEHVGSTSVPGRGHPAAGQSRPIRYTATGPARP